MKPEISYEEFQKLDIRVASILTAEAVPKTDRLIKLTLDIGEDQPRTVVAGIRGFYPPEELIGCNVAYLANLAPRKIRGIESRGMILAAFAEEYGNISGLALLTVSDLTDKVMPGARVG